MVAWVAARGRDSGNGQTEDIVGETQSLERVPEMWGGGDWPSFFRKLAQGIESEGFIVLDVTTRELVERPGIVFGFTLARTLRWTPFD